MTILAVDDEPMMLRQLQRELRKVFPQAEILAFASCTDVLDWLDKTHGTDLRYAFLDVKLREMLGTELALRIRDYNPQTRVLFCTAYSAYAMDAYTIHALGYLVKPITAEKLRDAVLQIEAQIGIPRPCGGKLTVHTFGNFEVLYNGVPLTWEREKSKELLALLIDRQGMPMTNGEIISVLWEKKPSDEYLHTLLYSLRSTLETVGCGDVLVRSRNHTRIDVSKVQCDLYDFLRGYVSAVHSYNGEYMTNYSWAESTNAKLYTGRISDFLLAAQC